MAKGGRGRGTLFYEDLFRQQSDKPASQSGPDFNPMPAGRGDIMQLMRSQNQPQKVINPVAPLKTNLMTPGQFLINEQKSSTKPAESK